MKKKFYFIPTLAIALFSCSEEHFPDELAGGYGNVLTASLPAEGFSTKMDITMEGNNGQLTWSDNDAFAAYSATGNFVPYTIVPTEAGKKDATFKAPLDIFIPEYAVFPARFAKGMNQNSIQMNLPSEYGLDSKSQNAPMLGKVEGNTVAFKHLCGIIRINFTKLPEGYNTVKVVTSNDIAGTFKVEDVNAEACLLVADYNVNDHKKEVKIVHNGNDAPYYLPLPAGRYDEIHIFAVGEKDYQLYDATNKTVACGEIYNITKDYLVSASNEDFKTLRSNILKDKLSTPSESTIDGIIKTLNEADGSFNGINYAKAESGDWAASKHLYNLSNMVSAYIDANDTKYFGNADLHKAIENALDYWVTKKPEHWNWWNHQVEEGKLLGTLLVKMREAKEDLNTELKNKVLDLMKERCGHPYDKTGANRTDVAMHWLYRASATDDKDVLSVAYHSFLSALSYTTEEGFQHDGSFFQHGTQLYIGGYGEEALKGTTQMAVLFAGTSIKLPQEKLDLLSNFMLNTFFGTIRGKYMSFSVMGRSVSRKGNLDKSSTRILAQRMIAIDPAHAAEYQAIINRLNGANPSAGVTASHTHFFNADYTLHVRPKYTFDVRMVSENTCRVEMGNNENLKGYFMADGSTNILVDGDEYYDIMPAWLWARLPGVTSPNITNVRIPQNPADWGVLGTSTFAGGVSDGLYGASAYSYYDNYSGINTGANKSWFFFDDEIVCMGKVNSASTNVLTTVNQCCKWGEVTVDGTPMSGEQDFENPKCIYHNKVGYVFPEGGNIWVMNKSLKGNWKLINRGESGVITKDIFGVGFKHDTEDRKSYAYMVVPGISSAKELETYTQENSPIAIVCNSENVQSVYHKKLNNWQTIFFKANEEVTYKDMKLKADRRCAIMIENTGNQYKIFVADPAQTKTTIHIDFTTTKGETKRVSANFGGSEVYAGASKEFTVSL